MLSERFNWDRLRVFRLVADARSMTAAARTVGESVPTVSRRINELEQELGKKVFRRSKRGVELTSAGRSLRELVEQMQSLVESVGDNIVEADRSVSGAIKVKASDGLGSYWVARHLPSFERQLPNIRIDLEIGLATEDVLDRSADVAIVFEQPTHPEIIAQPLGTLHYLCFASERYLEMHGEPTTIFDLPKHKILLHSDYIHQVEKWSKSIRELGNLIGYAGVTNSATALLTLCRNGGGVAILPSYVAAIDESLVPLKLPSVAPIQFWLTYTERIRRNRVGMATIEWLLTIFNGSDYPWFGKNCIAPSEFKKTAEFQRFSAF